MAEVIAPEAVELKRLGGLKDAVVSGTEYVSEKAGPLLQRASSLYEKAHQSVPSYLKPGLEQIEKAMVYYGKPLATQAKEKAPLFLVEIDGKVDSTFITSKEVVEHQLERLQDYSPSKLQIRARELVSENFPEKYEAFNKARGHYLNLIEQGVGKVRSALPEVPVDAIMAALDDARHTVADKAHIAFDRVSHAWEVLLKRPQVSKLLSKTAPAVSIARAQAERTISAVRENARYQKYVLPLVTPIANTAAYAYLENKLVRVVSALEGEVSSSEGERTNTEEPSTEEPNAEDSSVGS